MAASVISAAHESKPDAWIFILGGNFQFSIELNVKSYQSKHEYLHVVWLGNVINYHPELGKLASYEGYVFDGGRVALEKSV